MTLKIRPLEKSDWTDWQRLWRGYLEFYETGVADEIYSSTFSRLLSDAPGEFNGLVAELDNTPVGIAHFLSHRHCWRIEDVIYLQDLYVDPKVRNHGIARALIEAVYAEADQQETPAVYWLTQSSNQTARRLYDRLAHDTGFIRYAR
jgi:GNAT superfamily N-acetyltransferase